MLREEGLSQILLYSSEFYLYPKFILSSAVKEVQGTPKTIYNISLAFGLLINKDILITVYYKHLTLPTT